MAKEQIVLVDGASLFADDGDIDPVAFRDLMNSMLREGEPEMTLEEAKELLAEEFTDDLPGN
jgi:hypothetical protein